MPHWYEYGPFQGQIVHKTSNKAEENFAFQVLLNWLQLCVAPNNVFNQYQLLLREDHLLWLHNYET